MNRENVISDLRSGSLVTDQEKELLLDYYQHKLIPESALHKQARKLAIKRQSLNDDSDFIDTVTDW